MNKLIKYAFTYRYTYVVTCVIVVLISLYQTDVIPKLSVLGQYGNFYDYQTTQPTLIRQMDGHYVSTESEMARRKLTRNEQELWNFLAAQLHLHSGYLIQRLSRIENVINSVIEYKSVLLKDVDLCQAQLEAETSVTVTPLMRILYHIESNLTILFENLLYELNRTRNTLPSQLPNQTKEKIKFRHIHVQSLLQQLTILTDHQAASRELGNKIRQHMHKLQNPQNCSSARKLLCGVCGNLHNCGFGCTLWHIGLCQVLAYLSNRTMILDCSGWGYSSRGWEAAFLPITNCTLQHVKGDYFSMTDFETDTQLPELFNPTTPVIVRINMPIFNRGMRIFPPAVPRDLLNKILRFNSDPPSWWWGQFKTWAMRLNTEIARAVDEHIHRHNVTDTVVGLHIRRTDKTAEAEYHTLDEYMVHAAEWYDAYELTHPNVQRKIYLATDEPEIIRQATTRYPNYEFIYDRNIISSAAPKSRYNEQSLLGTLKDIYSLICCDYVVCTFSSTMCRLVYELSQAQYGDTHRFRSIDSTYFVPGQGNEYMPVIYDHNATYPSEIDVQTGDVVQFFENHWDGYTKVKDVNKTKTGLIPTFKIDKIFKAYNYSSNVKT